MNFRVSTPEGHLIPVRSAAEGNPESAESAPTSSVPNIAKRWEQDKALVQTTDLARLARFSFDAFWDARVTDLGLQVTIYPLRDLSRDFGLPDGTLHPLTIGLWHSKIHPDDRPAHLRAIQQALECGGHFSAEYRTLHADGSTMWWEDVGDAVEFMDDRPVRLIGAARNVTERRQNEERLRLALEELEGLKSRLEVEVNYLREQASEAVADKEFVGRSPVIQGVLRRAARVAESESTVLLTGETGTGKGMIARAIHRLSRRKTRPLVTVNCGALPSSLIESELFGHEKGAFTGATARRPGRFEVADGGTLFLDELGELPLEIQSKLLRVLERGEFERVGSSVTRKVDVRLIAATHRNLPAMLADGRFRQDLYYRLNVFPIEVPSLRDRSEDIPLLVAYLLEKKCAELGKRLKSVRPEQLELLCAYDWPGNIRELENVLERAIILSPGPDLAIEAELGFAMRRDRQPTQDLHTGRPEHERTLDEVERTHLLSVCRSTKWKIKGADGAAARLGLTPSTLYFRMKKHGIQRPPASRRTHRPERS